MQEFLRIWFLAIVRPSAAFRELAEKPAPQWGFVCILVRFMVTALTSILALHLFNWRPFVPSYLSFLVDADYYRAEIFFLPIFGLAAWLLSKCNQENLEGLVYTVRYETYPCATLDR